MKRQIVFLVVLAASFFAFFPYEVEATPALEFTTDAGEIINNESLKGKPTLLVLWASWCGICQRELPNVKTLYEQKKEKGLQVLAIGVQDKKANIARYVGKHPEIFIFPVVHDRGNQASNGFNVRGVPLFVLLDAKGEVAKTHVGGGFLKDPAFMKLINDIEPPQTPKPESPENPLTPL